MEEIEYSIFGEGSHILTNQKRENGAFSLLIGRNTSPKILQISTDRKSVIHMGLSCNFCRYLTQ